MPTQCPSVSQERLRTIIDKVTHRMQQPTTDRTGGLWWACLFVW